MQLVVYCIYMLDIVLCPTQHNNVEIALARCWAYIVTIKYLRSLQVVHNTMEFVLLVPRCRNSLRSGAKFQNSTGSAAPLKGHVAQVSGLFSPGTIFFVQSL